MIEQEKFEAIERATRAHTMALNGQHEDKRDAWSAMRAAPVEPHGGFAGECHTASARLTGAAHTGVVWPY